MWRSDSDGVHTSGLFPALFLSLEAPLKLKDVQLFQQLLRERKINSELVIVESGHGPEVIRQNPDSIEKIIQFLNIQFNRK